jgi:dipeptidase E
MKNIILASTSTLFGEDYLAYLKPVIKELFAGISEIIFVPYARPGGISHDDYTAKAAMAFKELNITLKGLHSFNNPEEAIKNARDFLRVVEILFCW